MTFPPPLSVLNLGVAGMVFGGKTAVTRKDAACLKVMDFGLDDGFLVIELSPCVDLQLAFDGGLEVRQPREGIARCASIDVVI
jgi:hypothetical protein